jgi:transposase
VETLAAYLHELSGHHLPDPFNNARKLKQVALESFALPESLSLPIQRILELTLDHIRFLEGQIAQVDAWTADEVSSCPAIANLTTIPGVGPVFSAGVGSEVGDTQRYLQSTKWDKKRKQERPRNLRDAEDAVAKIAGLWWPRTSSGDFEAQDRHMAKSGNRYLRYYLIQAADHTPAQAGSGPHRPQGRRPLCRSATPQRVLSPRRCIEYLIAYSAAGANLLQAGQAT